MHQTPSRAAVRLLALLVLSACRNPTLIIAVSDAGTASPCGCPESWVCCPGDRLCGQTADECPAETLVVSPPRATVALGRAFQFAGCSDCDWQVEEADAGSIDATGLYRAPERLGTFHVVAQRKNLSARAEVVVRALELEIIAGQFGGPSFTPIDGVGQSARFSRPTSLTADEQGNAYLIDLPLRAAGVGIVSDIVGSIRRIDGKTLAVETLGRTLTWADTDKTVRDGPLSEATFVAPYDLAADGNGHLLVADFCLIRQIDLATRVVTTVIGDPATVHFPPDASGVCEAHVIQAIASDGHDRVFVAPRLGGLEVVSLSTKLRASLMPPAPPPEGYWPISRLAYLPASLDSEKLMWLWSGKLWGSYIDATLVFPTQWSTQPVQYAGLAAMRTPGCLACTEGVGLTADGVLHQRINGSTHEWSQTPLKAARAFTKALDSTLWAADDEGAIWQLGVGVVAGKQTLGEGVQDGPGETAQLRFGYEAIGVLTDDGRSVLTPDLSAHRIRKIDLVTRDVTTPWSDLSPVALARDASSLIAIERTRVLRAPLTGGEWQVVASGFRSLTALAVSGAGRLVVLDSWKATMFDVDLTTGLSTPLREGHTFSGLAADGAGHVFTVLSDLTLFELYSGAKYPIAPKTLGAVYGLAARGNQLYFTTSTGALFTAPLAPEIVPTELIASGAVIPGVVGATARLQAPRVLAITSAGDVVIGDTGALLIIR